MKKHDDVDLASSYPLVDFISRFRLRDRGQGDNSLEAGLEYLPTSPLLQNRLSMAVRSPSLDDDYEEVPYPLPTAFIQPQQQPQEDNEASDEDEAQSIKSYCSDQIRNYDRLSLRSPSWPQDLASKEAMTTSTGCPFSLSSLCLLPSDLQANGKGKRKVLPAR